ncbi:MAG: peptidoglycan-binding protein, partial [Stellaceae bacterium]
MREGRIDTLIAGAIVALIVTMPASAGPQVESAVPLPPTLNGHRFIAQRETKPLPPVPLAARTPAAATPTAREPLAQTAPAAQPAVVTVQPVPSGGFDIKGALDKLLAASDGQITDKLRSIVAAKSFDKRIEREGDRQAMKTFYGAHNYAPLWIHDGRLTARAKAVIARLQHAAADGLDPSDYPVPDFGTFTGAEALANGDIKLTQSVLTYARHLQTGRIAPARVYAQVDFPDHTPQPAAILKKIVEAADVNAAFDSFNPPHEGFRALKRKLAGLRANANDDALQVQDRIPVGNIIKPGERDARVPMLRQRLGLKGRPEDTRYDRALYNAVRTLEQRHGLRPDGIVGSKVIALINGPKPRTTSQAIDIVLANMERWRWLPRGLGETYVMV